MAGGDSFEEFYATAYRRIVGQVFALLGDLHEAEDLTQDAFAKASFTGRGSVPTTRQRPGCAGSPSTRRAIVPAAPGEGWWRWHGTVPRTWCRPSPRTGWTSTVRCGSSRLATARSSASPQILQPIALKWPAGSEKILIALYSTPAGRTQTLGSCRWTQRRGRRPRWS